MLSLLLFACEHEERGGRGGAAPVAPPHLSHARIAEGGARHIRYVRSQIGLYSAAAKRHAWRAPAPDVHAFRSTGAEYKLFCRHWG